MKKSTTLIRRQFLPCIECLESRFVLTPVVRLVYLVPADKTYRADYPAAMASAIQNLQSWYKSQLANGKTFVLSDPVVQTFQTPHASNWYSTTGSGSQAFWNNVVSDGFALTGGEFNDPNNRWVFYIDADPTCGQIGGAGTSGVAALPANDLRGLTGQQNIPPCPNDPPDNGGLNRWIGGLGHELGHAFGLPHPPGCEDNDPNTPCPNTGALMWTGYTVYPNTFLLPADKDILNASPFFVMTAPPGLPAAANIITHSPEAFGYFVSQAYLTYLGRQADASGLHYWVSRLTSNLTDEGLEASFLSSDEYVANHGGTHQAWVIGMYHDLLGREPDQAGVAYWVNQLATGASPYSIAIGFAASAERESNRISDDYYRYLGRGPDQAGMSYWLNAFLHGSTNEDLVSGFVGSSEYFSDAGKGNRTVAGWIVAAYDDVLHRAPSASEIAYWTDFLT